MSPAVQNKRGGIGILPDELTLNKPFKRFEVPKMFTYGIKRSFGFLKHSLSYQ